MGSKETNKEEKRNGKTYTFPTQNNIDEIDKELEDKIKKVEKEIDEE